MVAFPFQLNAFMCRGNSVFFSNSDMEVTTNKLHSRLYRFLWLMNGELRAVTRAVKESTIGRKEQPNSLGPSHVAIGNFATLQVSGVLYLVINRIGIHCHQNSIHRWLRTRANLSSGPVYVVAEMCVPCNGTLGILQAMIRFEGNQLDS